MSVPMSSVYIALGIVGLGLGGHWIVNGALGISRALNITEGFVGLTLVALGTSFPELVTSVVAALKKESDIVIGNVVGSNIFNIFFTLGITALINPIVFDPSMNNFDMLMVMLATLFLIATVMIGKKAIIQKGNAYGFLIMYVAYVAFLVYRG